MLRIVCVGYDVTYCGHVTFDPGNATAKFPFDSADVDVIIDGCDDYLHDGLLDLRVAPEESIHRDCFGPQDGGQKALKINEQFHPEDLQEWTLGLLQLKEIETKWSRTYRRLNLRLSLRRNPIYYMVKVVIVVALLNLLATSAFALETVDAGADRLMFSATMFLATTAFLFVVGSELPKTPYLHSLDKWMIIAFIMQFLSALVTAVQLVLIRLGYSQDNFWIMDAASAATSALVTILPLAIFWVPQTIRATAGSNLTSKQLTLFCQSKLEPYGVCLKSGGRRG